MKGEDAYKEDYGLDEKKRATKEMQTPKLLSGSRRLRADDLLNFYLETWFNIPLLFLLNHFFGMSGII